MMPNDGDALTAWIQLNRMRFVFKPAHYTPDYVAWLAKQNGFDPITVYHRFSHFKHALSMTDPDTWAKKQSNWTIQELYAHANPVNLKDSWDDLGNYLMTGKAFE